MENYHIGNISYKPLFYAVYFMKNEYWLMIMVWVDLAMQAII